MAKAKFVLIAIFLFATSFAHAKYKEQITASAILRVAAASSPKNLKAVFNTMAIILDTVPVLIAPDGREFTRCGETTLAYVVPGLSRSIHLCKLVLAESHNSIAQTLIHEAAHLAGYMNECDATILEVAAMKSSGVGLAYRNGYMDRCGL
jgi:hypothetical protein